jgi:hypothetical protein
MFRLLQMVACVLTLALVPWPRKKVNVVEEDSISVLENSPPPFIPALALQQAWQQAMSNPCDNTVIKFCNGNAEISTGKPMPFGERGVLTVRGDYPMVRPDPEQWKSLSDYYPPASPGSPGNAYDVLTQAALELVGQWPRLTYKVFETPQNMKRLQEPPEVTAAFADVTRC